MRALSSDLRPLCALGYAAVPSLRLLEQHLPGAAPKAALKRADVTRVHGAAEPVAARAPTGQCEFDYGCVPGRLRGKDSNLDYLIQSQASYH
jgi:hypothetical protein